MEEQFVTYEIALALKELAFNKPCLAYYSINYDDIKQDYHGNLILGKDPEHLTCQAKMHYIYGQQTCLAPLWQQAIDFIREKYKIWINPICEYENKFHFVTGDMTDEMNVDVTNVEANSYYEGRKQTILEAIKIIKAKRPLSIIEKMVEDKKIISKCIKECGDLKTLADKRGIKFATPVKL